MSFNYSKNKDHGSQDSFWTSYSDLFLGLSTIFLMLYVTASLRSGTEGLRSEVENKKLSMQVQELQHQLKMYESVKNEYLEKQASKDEVQEYQELMDKLTLLQEDAKTEKEKLIQKALENDSKVQALNKYQQMVRNVLNANKMAKSKIISRDDLIKEQDIDIADKQKQINQLNSDIEDKKNLIAKGEAEIQKTERALQGRMKELQLALKNNSLTKAMYQKKVAEIQGETQAKVQELAQVNAQFEKQLKEASQQLGEVQGELSKTKAGLEEEKAAGAQKVAALKGKLDETKGKLGATESQLAKARAEIDARKMVASEIQKGFAKASVKADIDMETGDVVLDFGQAYFESGSDKLKSEMKSVIEKAMPIYSKSLFGNPKVSDKISSVEIIGFASPTYQGRYIDPNSTKSEDKAALKYNMDLSYRRANSIFSFMLDNSKLSFQHRNELLSLMKVSGRSFLEVMKVQDRNVATAAEFCKLHDCKKAQKVIIRFSMDPKK